MILSKGGTTTTLTVAMVCRLAVRRMGSNWGLCVVSVGDSPCFIYKQEEQKVYEVTAAIHSGQGRDPRDPGGCLGANLGDDPDLSNLICCFVPVAENDIIFLTSDGISDNFDPVTLRTALSTGIRYTGTPSLPLLTPQQRQQHMLAGIQGLLSRCSERDGDLISVHDLMNSLITYAINTTDQKRSFLEHAWVKTQDPSLTIEERRREERKLSQHSKTLGGKLDHATVVGFFVGELKFTDPRSLPRAKNSKTAHPPPSMEMHESSPRIRQVQLSRRSESVDDSYLRRINSRVRKPQDGDSKR